jgi:acyl-CoA synthetase (AMP-forming)/AMP-acid ligase II
MNIAKWLHQTALVRPDAPAIRLGERLHANYAEFAFHSWAIGSHLQTQYGIRRGDRVALFVKNCAEYLEVLYGVIWIGATVVPINNKLHPREAAWIIENSESKLVITETGDLYSRPGDLEVECLEVGIRTPEFTDTIGRANADQYGPPVDAEEDDIAWLFYTSGTTGRPKGVMTTHRNLRLMATSYALDADLVSCCDHSLYAAPMSHGAGLYNFQFVRAGACHVIPESQGFDPAEIQTLAEALGNLVFFAAPTMVMRLVRYAKQTGYRGDGIRTMIYGGGPMYLADITEALETFGPRFVHIYGQGETPMTITAMPRDIVADRTHPRAGDRRASVGVAQSCVEVRVVDENMKDKPPGEVGEIIVRGDTVMKGYWKNQKATDETIVGGWLKTGDLGAMDRDGFLTLTDRSKDVIISGGTNIYPREVEEAILENDSVFEVSVIGNPNPEWGEEVVAFVVVKDGAACDRESLDGWCRSRIASFKKPKTYVFVRELPKNSYGKVLKTSLRERLAVAEEEL